MVKAGGENPPGDVSNPASIVERFLEDHGIEYRRVEPRAGRVNIVARLGRSGGKRLILCGHLDVVPAGDSTRWSFPPFCGEVKNGEILGRGATDMKGGVAASLAALAALDQLDIEGEVVAAFVCDEEIGGDFGAKWLLDQNLIQGDACLIAEPSAYQHYGYTIDAGERGVLWLKFTALGKPAHGSWPVMGRNAILLLSRFLEKLQEVKELKVKTPNDAQEMVLNGKEVLAKIAQEVGRPHEELSRLLDHYSANVGTICGGTKTNVVPERCEAEVDFRIPIGGSREELEAFVKKRLPEGVLYEVVQESEPSYSPLTESLLRALTWSAEEIFGTRVPPIAIWATTDAWRFRKKGMPTFTFGPGFIEKTHAYDESIRASDVVKASKVYALTALRFLARA